MVACVEEVGLTQSVCEHWSFHQKLTSVIIRIPLHSLLYLVHAHNSLGVNRHDSCGRSYKEQGCVLLA